MDREASVSDSEQSAASLSVIIPTFNEDECLGRTLESVSSLSPRAAEVLVVDARSTDSTRSIAKGHGARVIETPIRRRAYQLDLGARAARGELLFFLHADTQIPRSTIETVRATLADPSISLAGFTSIMRGPEGVQRLATLHNWIKTYYAPLVYRPVATLFSGLRLIFGDQCMFCRRRDYIIAGGFDPELDIMEEADLCLKMNRLGRIRQVPERVYSSDRRVRRLGTLRANVLFIWIALAWAVGVQPAKLRSLYDRT